MKLLKTNVHRQLSFTYDELMVAQNLQISINSYLNIKKDLVLFEATEKVLHFEFRAKFRDTEINV